MTDMTQKELDHAFLLTDDITTMKVLLNAGANINADSDEWHKFPKLWDACRKNDMKLVKFLIAQPGIDLNIRSGSLNSTPIMETKDVDIVKLLKEAGADINAVDNEGSSVIIFQCGNEKIVRYLSSCNVDMSIKNKYNYDIYKSVKNHSWFTTQYTRLSEEVKSLNESDCCKLINSMLIGFSKKGQVNLIKDMFDGISKEEKSKLLKEIIGNTF